MKQGTLTKNKKNWFVTYGESYGGRDVWPVNFFVRQEDYIKIINSNENQLVMFEMVDINNENTLPDGIDNHGMKKCAKIYEFKISKN